MIIHIYFNILQPFYRAYQLLFPIFNLFIDNLIAIFILLSFIELFRFFVTNDYLILLIIFPYYLIYYINCYFR